jgi:hypothetical protein
MATVSGWLATMAAEAGMTTDAYIAQVLPMYIPPVVPNRYRHLVSEVLCRLPADWDAARTWQVEVSSEQTPLGYASARHEIEADGDNEQVWIMTLYPSLPDRLPDKACLYVIAHEFGHIASGLCGPSLVHKGIGYAPVKGTANQYEEAVSTGDREDIAEKLALEWGFSAELQAFFRDASGSSSSTLFGPA